MAYEDAVDESYGRIPISTVKQLGIKLVMGYISWNTDGKNMSADWIKSYHKAHAGVWLGWESVEGRPAGGYQFGYEDATESARQLKALFSSVGYQPRNKLYVPFAYDTDVVSGHDFASAFYYIQGANKAFEDSKINVGAGMYGEYDLMQYLYARGIRNGLFQTYAWSDGKVSAHTALYQYLNNQVQGGASVDLDHIMHAPLIGAWWPPGHPLDHPDTENLSTLEAQLMAWYGSKEAYEKMLDKKNSDLVKAVGQVVHDDNHALARGVLLGRPSKLYPEHGSPAIVRPGGLFGLLNSLGAKFPARHPVKKAAAKKASAPAGQK